MANSISPKQRNNVNVLGDVKKPVLFYAHGFGCHQGVWPLVCSHFVHDYCQVLFDYVGSGNSDISQFSFSRYSSLEGYAQDIIEILDELSFEQQIFFIGHSVSCSIGTLVANKKPELFSALIFLGPSPSFINDLPEYYGGYERDEIESLLIQMENDFSRWTQLLVKAVIGDQINEQAHDVLMNSFCKTEPLILNAFAKATFLADNRESFKSIHLPTLILQHKRDPLAAIQVGQYLKQQIPASELVILNANGHAAHITAPETVVMAIKHFLRKFNENP